MAKKLIWTDELVKKFWDHYSEDPKFYFTYQFADNICYQLKQYIDEADCIVDYGCGAGYLSEKLLASNKKVLGVDYSSDSVKKTEIFLSKEQGFMGAFLVEDALKEYEKKFDLAFVVEVIEHLSDEHLDSLVETVKKLVKPGGHIIFTTPNNENLESSMVYCPVTDATFHRWQHVRSWNRESISKYMQSHGLQMEKILETNFAFDQRSIKKEPIHIRLVRRLFKIYRYIPQLELKPHLACICRV